MAARDGFRMQHLGEDLEGLEQSWSRAVEEVVSVGQVHVPARDGPQGVPFRALREPAHFRARPPQVEATRSYHDDVRLGFGEHIDLHPR